MTTPPSSGSHSIRTAVEPFPLTLTWSTMSGAIALENATKPQLSGCTPVVPSSGALAMTDGAPVSVPVVTRKSSTSGSYKLPAASLATISIE